MKIVLSLNSKYQNKFSPLTRKVQEVLQEIFLKKKEKKKQI
jgi:hypothetical protein